MDTRQIATFVPKLVIRAYQLMSRGAARQCRFYPTCSNYALEALETSGLLKGLWLTVRRLLKCHPWHSGGYDPVHL